MHRSSTETKRLAACLFLSALLHLVVVLLTPPLTPDPQPAFQVIFRPPPRALETRPFDPAKPALRERQMQRLVVKSALPQLAQESTESAPLGEVAEQLPPEVRDDMAHLAKRMRIEWSDYVNIDSLLLEHMAAEGDYREDYVRFPLPNTGTGRDRALEVIERAIEAMGGRKRLLAIQEMSAMVWIEVNLKELNMMVVSVTPYLYPVATWHYEGWGNHAVSTKKKYKVEVSFDPAVPNPSYVSKNPKIQPRIFENLFGHRWMRLSGNLPSDLAAMRLRGEEVRWHFIDRFMGEGVALDYLGQERSRDGACFEVVLVDDRKFGHYFEALFDCRTALLAKTKEKLTPQEEQWFRQANPRVNPPTWITVYDRYQEVQGVLTPHRWKRAQGRDAISVYLQWAYNGEEPSTAEPVR